MFDDAWHSGRKGTFESDSTSHPKCVMYIARPGPTPDNYIENTEKPCNTSRWSSSDTTALSSEGIESAQRIAEAFKDVNFDSAYCSYAQRTFETAQIILGSRSVEIKPRKKFYEMRIGPTEGKTTEEIIDFFCKETGYPDVSTQDKFPKLWAKRKGDPLKNGNDCLLDDWHPNMDTFDDFSARFMDRIKIVARKNLGKTILIIPHGTPMKAIIAEAKGITSDRVLCAKGSYYVAEIDGAGNVTIREDMHKGISVELTG